MFANAELVTVSDIHLRSADDPRCLLLARAIESAIQQRPRCFALLGDIFDFYLGNQEYFRRKFAMLGERLEALAATGTRVLFIEGNHEFELSSAGWRGVEVVSETLHERGITWQSESGARILLTHGDLFNAPRSYRAFRTLIKSRPALVAASLVPGVMMDAYALQHAMASRARDPYRTLDDAAILGEARAFARVKNADHLIFGHFHRPWAVPVDGHRQDRLVMCMDSWDVPNALVFDGKKFHREFLGDNARVVAIIPGDVTAQA